MDRGQRIRARNSIYGAFVADAASMGLHWVYSQKRIIDLTPKNPEFRQPDEADFEGGVGYFAHENKKVGDLSQYGEQMLVMLRSLSQTNGIYNKANYTEAFRRHFGYGGEFVGYIDKPTRQTLDRIYRDEGDGIDRVNAIPYDGNQRDKAAMLTKVLAAAKQYEGNALKDRVSWIADSMEEPDVARSYALSLVDALASKDDFPGAVDEQLPAVSKLPPLVACHFEDPKLTEISESAIKVTNNTPRALDFGHICTSLLQSSIEGMKTATAIDTAINAGSEKAQPQLKSALASNDSVSVLSKEYGLHCDLGAGVPSILHNLSSASDYKAAIRANIYAGGDNCGRGIILGAVCGAKFGLATKDGIPGEWLQKLNRAQEIENLVNKLLPD